MFKNFYDMMVEGQMLTINLMKKGDKLIVCVLPRSEKVKDAAQNHFTPLNLEGTPTELDAGFIAAISNPVKRVSGMLKNMADFEEKAEKAAAESKALKDKTDKVNKLIKEAENLEKDKPIEALAVYKKALEQDKYNQKIISKIAAMQEKTMQGSLFAENANTQPSANSSITATTQPVQPAVPVIEEATKIETTGASSGIDMFEQVVKSIENTVVEQENPEPPAPPVVNPILAGLTPELLAQLNQMLAAQNSNQSPK